MNIHHYVTKSLELHLFFGRIMKEHALFLRASFTQAASGFAQKAEAFQQKFEHFLCQIIELSDRVVSSDILCSGEIVTEYTLQAEHQTERLTAIAIDQSITAKELKLTPQGENAQITREQLLQVRHCNRAALVLLDEFIGFKENLLRNIAQCRLFTMNYPLLIEHITREAKLYRRYVEILEQSGCLSAAVMRDSEVFWNRIMMEHALFIRGLLDPCEEDLTEKADGFARCFRELLDTSRRAQDQALTTETLEQTIKFRDYKAVAVTGIQQCRIRGIILPLLADHVLREANHYIRLLQTEEAAVPCYR